MSNQQEKINLLNLALEEYIQHLHDHFDSIYSLLDFNEIIKDQNYLEWINNFRSALPFNKQLIEFDPDTFLLKKPFSFLSFKIDDFSEPNNKTFNIYFSFFNDKINYVYKKILTFDLTENDSLFKHPNLNEYDIDDDVFKDIENFILENIDKVLNAVQQENKNYHNKIHSTKLVKQRLFYMRESYNSNNLEHLLLENAISRIKSNIRKFLGV